MAAKKIKLFVDAHSFDKEFQGAQTFIRELYNHLLAERPDIDIYIGARDTDNIRKQFPLLPPQNILPYKNRGINILRFIFDIPAYIKKYKFDFAHFQYISPKKIAGCQYIVTMHDMLFNDFRKDFPILFSIPRNYLFGRSIKNADIKTTVSEYSKSRICDYYQIPADEMHIIQNGVSNSLLQYQASKQEAEDWVAKKFGISNFILYTSRIEPRKNHLLLLQKYLSLKLYEKGISLVFIGKASIYTPGLNELIKSLTAEQKQFFRWIPQAEQADLAAFYRACRLFVYPSKAEGFGIPPLEAAICGAPVLCSSETAMKNFNFFAPYAFNPANQADFEQKLAFAVEQPPGYAFTKRVAEHVAHQYHWEKSSIIFYNLLQANFHCHETKNSDFRNAGHPELLWRV
ncbi:glycosyltransferase family 4 protein [Mucilaginibacter rubeus]|uniref:Glycosyltransferase family 4 protein n=1 Tax=Mucilaginibacter rubeus TaxID=2027860 RepID=A0A5C1HV81_9SPHI|nr:glycosyltransferase family 1 protein [Mucilaginibacter rubeus]QEM09585.1 glycosyltransferase family 4 protein [Mucilaginibacter rubeus]